MTKRQVLISIGVALCILAWIAFYAVGSYYTGRASRTQPPEERKLEEQNGTIWYISGTLALVVAISILIYGRLTWNS